MFWTLAGPRGFVRQVPQPPGKRDLPLSIRLLDFCMRAASEVTLSGGTALERPPAKLRARVLPESRASARLHLEEAVAHCGLSLRYHVAWQATFPDKKVANRAIVETSKAGHLRAQGGGQRLEEGSLYNHVVQELSDLRSSDGGILSSGSPQGLLLVPETCPWIFINSPDDFLPSRSCCHLHLSRLRCFFGARQEAWRQAISVRAAAALRACVALIRRAGSGHDSMTTFWRRWGAASEPGCLKFFCCAEFVGQGSCTCAAWAFGLPHPRSRFFCVCHGVTKPWRACAFSAEHLGAGVLVTGQARDLDVLG